jgi:hypothetical protein
MSNLIGVPWRCSCSSSACLQMPQGVTGSRPFTWGTTMASASTSPRGSTDSAACRAARSAQMPTGKEAFSWLQPGTISPEAMRSATPTLNLEYFA